ncbi:MAG TPA: hypothetical protein VES64_08260 [Allosphingosinicella sp.]|nr:hypothetical protein [Allosphingosinicella sp.]
MGFQVKAFALLFAVLIAVDALVYHGEYRGRVGHQISSLFSSFHGPGPGRNWSQPKPSRNN